jgi:cyclopentanol dehydrogenase
VDASPGGNRADTNRERPGIAGQRLSGKVAIVTGGARGMGASHVRVLAEHGATVLFGDLQDELGQSHADRLREEGLQALYQHLDVRSPDQWQAMAATCRDRFGRLDVLVNNAGIVDTLRAEDASEETWRRTIDTNQMSVFLALKYCIPLMRASGGGSVINVSSVYGLVGAEGYIAYTASKGAVTLMTKSAAVTYGPDNVRVNSVHPGVIRTPMLEEELAQLPPGALEDFLAATPLRREGAAEEVSGCVLFLASDESSFVSGTELIVDGGLLAGR